MKTTLLASSAGLIAGIFAVHAALAAEQIIVVELAKTDTTIDLGAKGDSVGDLLTFANPLMSSDGKSEVGKDQGYCVRVIVGKSWECVWTALLKDGQITVEGPFYDSGDSVLAITGGTGKYAGARGSMSLHARDAKGSAFDFTYKLL